MPVVVGGPCHVCVYMKLPANQGAILRITNVGAESISALFF